MVDLSEIENSTASGGAAEGEVKIAQNVTEDAVTSDDLDYDPYFQDEKLKRANANIFSIYKDYQNLVKKVTDYL